MSVPSNTEMETFFTPSVVLGNAPDRIPPVDRPEFDRICRGDERADEAYDHAPNYPPRRRVVHVETILWMVVALPIYRRLKRLN